jgi:hypothetical protein
MDEHVISCFDRFVGRIGVVSPAHNAGDFVSYPYVSTDWIDLVGWYVHPNSYHFMWDTVIEMLGDATNIEYCSADKFLMAHERIPRHMEDKYREDALTFVGWCVTGRKTVLAKLRGKIDSLNAQNGIYR